jgi:hypothetical protein
MPGRNANAIAASRAGFFPGMGGATVRIGASAALYRSCMAEHIEFIGDFSPSGAFRRRLFAVRCMDNSGGVVPCSREVQSITGMELSPSLMKPECIRASRKT